MLHALLFATMISVFAIAEASAQTDALEPDFSGLGGKTLSVIDDSGFDFRGRLVTFNADTVTLRVNGQDRTFDRKNVAAIYERGNSVKKGIILGALTGPVLAAAALTSGDDLTADELGFGIMIFSGLGILGGAAIDALIPGKRLLYRRPGAEVGYPKRLGMMLGITTGMIAGFSVGARKDDCDHTPPGGYPYIDCDGGEKIVNGLKVAAPFALAGAGLGILIDRTIGKPHPNIAISPSFARGAAGMSTTFSW